MNGAVSEVGDLLKVAEGPVRFRAVSLVLKTSRLDLLAHILLWPVASLLYLYNAIAAGFSRRIKWRGITYELKSPTEAVIISRDS